MIQLSLPKGCSYLETFCFINVLIGGGCEKSNDSLGKLSLAHYQPTITCWLTGGCLFPEKIIGFHFRYKKLIHCTLSCTFCRLNCIYVFFLDFEIASRKIISFDEKIKNIFEIDQVLKQEDFLKIYYSTVKHCQVFEEKIRH